MRNIPILVLAMLLSVFLTGCGGDSSDVSGGANLSDGFSPLYGSGELRNTGNGATIVNGGPVNVSPGTGQPVVFNPNPGAGGEVIFTEIRIDPNPAAVAVGSTVQLVTTGVSNTSVNVALPGQTNATVSYAVAAPTVATVSSTGLVSGVSAGSTSITVTVVNHGETFTATVPVVVTATGGGGQSIAFLLVSNPTPNGSGGSITSIAVAPDGTLSVADNDTSVNRPLSIALTPSRQIVYTLNFFGFGGNGGDFSVFSPSASTGQLTFLGADLDNQTSPQKMVIHPSGRFAYVTDFFGEVFGYLIGSDGRLTPNPAVTNLDTGSRGVTLPTFNASGTRMYVPDGSDDTLTIFDVDTATGALSFRNPDFPVGAGSAPVFSVLDSSGNFLYVANNGNDTITSYAIDSNGDLTLVHTEPTSPAPESLAVHPALPVLYAGSSGASTVASFALNGTGGVTAFGTPQPSGVTPTTILVEPSGRFVYAICRGNTPAARSLISAYTVNPSDGSLTFVRDYPFAELSFASGGVLLPASP